MTKLVTKVMVVCCLVVLIAFAGDFSNVTGYAEGFEQYQWGVDHISGEKYVQVICTYHGRNDDMTIKFIGVNWMIEVPFTTKIEQYIVDDNTKLINYQVTVMTNRGPVPVHYIWVEDFVVVNEYEDVFETCPYIFFASQNTQGI